MDSMRIGLFLRRAAASALFFALAIAAAPLLAQDNFLWSVEDGAGARLFLFGSIHMADPETYPLPEIVDQAYQASEQLVVEADVTSPDMGEIMSQVSASGVYLGSGRSLWDDLGPSLSEGLAKCAATVGLPPQLFEHLRPWLAAMTLEALRLKSMGYDEELGIDRHFIVRAKEERKPIGELETIAEQMDLFTSLTEEESLKLLQVTVIECDEAEEGVNELMAVWKAGDLDGFERIYFGVYHEHPELGPILDKVILNRNRLMHKRLQPYLYPGQTVFVVVGAAHMVGSEGLPELFRAQGMKVTRY